MLLRLGLRFVAGALVCGLSSSHARDFDKELQAKIKRLVEKNGKGAERELKQRLIRMAKQDQAVRAGGVTAITQ